jgi:MFS family permease
MLAHLAITGDAKQHQRWKDRMEAIIQADAVDRARDPETKAILADKAAWQQLRATGRFGANFGLALGALWMSVLLPLYAVAHGFGWLAASTFLLPVPIAWRFGRKLWERAAVAGMRDLGKKPSLRKKVRAAGRSLMRSFSAGFGFGFSLVFLQALITWFMTPAPTIIQEILLDARDGAWAGIITGMFSVLLAPLVGRQAPGNQEERALVSYEP